MRNSLRGDPSSAGCRFHVHPGKAAHAVERSFEFDKLGKSQLGIRSEQIVRALPSEVPLGHLRFKFLELRRKRFDSFNDLFHNGPRAKKHTTEGYIRNSSRARSAISDN